MSALVRPGECDDSSERDGSVHSVGAEPSQLHLHIPIDREVLALIGRVVTRLAARNSLALRTRNRDTAKMQAVSSPAAAPSEGARPPHLSAPPANVPMPGLVAAYEHDLARRGGVIKQQRKAKACVEALVEAMEIRTLEQLTVPTVKEYLARRRREASWSAKTHNNHLCFLRDFGRFLVEEGHWRENAIERIRGAKRRGVKYGGDLTGDRAFVLEEVRAIIEAAEQCEIDRPWVAAARRSACYRLFALTGLRHLEMKKLPWSAVYLDDAEPRIVCEDVWTKNGKTEVIPLPPEAVELLKEQRLLTGKTRRVWKHVPSLNTLNADMERAGVPKIDKRGRPAGFHSFRKGLNTIARHSGVDADTRQRLLRHSDPRLTMGTYSDVLGPELAAAARLLPRILGKARELSTNRPGPRSENLTSEGDADDDDARDTAPPHHREPPGPGSRRGRCHDFLQRESGPDCSPRTGFRRYGGISGEGGIRTPRIDPACPPVLTKTTGAATYAAALHAAIDAFFAVLMEGGREVADGNGSESESPARDE